MLNKLPGRENEPLEQIRSLFENRSYFVRWKFLNEYHFNDNYHDYYVNFIAKNAFSIKNWDYLSDLICFTIDHHFFDATIVKTWYRLLTKSNKIIVLLSVLDYFNLCPLNKLPVDFEITLLKILKRHRRKILKNQIYINLLLLDETNEKYLTLLLNSLKETKDHISIKRTISTLKEFNSNEIVYKIGNVIDVFNLNDD